MRYRQYQLGFTLLECLISLSLGAMIVALALSLLVAAIKNNEASMQTLQKQAAVVSVLQWMVNDIANAGAFGCSRTCALSQGLVGLQGSAHELSLAYQGQPRLALLEISDDGLHVRAEPTHHFNQNTALLISSPDEVQRVVVADDHLDLTSPLHLKTHQSAVIGPLLRHTFSFNPQQHTLSLKSNQGEAETVLDEVQSVSFTYDVKTADGVIETQSVAGKDGFSVCGVNIMMRVSGQTWVRVAPVLSQCV